MAQAKKSNLLLILGIVFGAMILLVLVAFMLMGAGAYFATRSLSDARSRTTETTAQAVLSATTIYLNEPGHTCPTVEQLVASEALFRVQTDGWGHPYRIECGGADGADVVVSSSGPDGVAGNADDIHVR